VGRPADKAEVCSRLSFVGRRRAPQRSLRVLQARQEEVQWALES
jgi:hypothetical protein